MMNTKLTKTKSNQRGSILITAFISMIVLSMAVASVAQLSARQFTVTNQKVEALNQDMYGEALIEQSVFDFEDFLQNNDYDFDAYFASLTDNGVTDYGILVENVSGLSFPEDNQDFTDYDGETNFVFRFTYTYNEGLSRMVMYVYLTNTAAYVEPVNPFDFAIATNGTYLQSGGFINNDPQFYGNQIVFSNVAPFINQKTGNQDKTPSDSAYPNLDKDNKSVAYYTDGFYFCEPDCWDVSGSANDPFVFQSSEMLNVETEPNSIETGTINPDKVINDFFNGYEVADDIVKYVREDGPTLDRVIDDDLDIDTLGSDVWTYYSGDPGVECTGWHWWSWCYYVASDKQYTRLNPMGNDFDPLHDDIDLDFASIYQGDLVFAHDFTITNYDEDQTETMIIDGDLHITNSNSINLRGFFVVLGDLYFDGSDDVTINGGFYVTGQTYIDFEDGAGIKTDTNHKVGFSLLTMDNIYINHLFEQHKKRGEPKAIQWLVYTDESMFVDAVNNHVIVKGIWLSAARGASGNDIPVVDESGTPVTGIIINSMDGYIDKNGNAVNGVRKYKSFSLTQLTEHQIHNTFMQIPTFDLVAVSEGVYSSYRSEIFYYNSN
jgi:hypothetical protein